MKSKNKIFIVISIIVVLILISLIVVLKTNGNIITLAYQDNINMNDNSVELEQKSSNDIEVINNSNNIKEEDIYLKISSRYYWEHDVWDSKVRQELSENIIIGVINSVDDAINYNPAKETYTKTNTIGTITVTKVLKGNLEENSIIPFIRSGGTISVEEYEKSLTEAQKNKQNLNKLTIQEKKNKYVKDTVANDIELETGKLYLMYLNYRPDYGRYLISYAQFGLLEVKKEDKTKSINELSSIKVKNNLTNTWENLSDVVIIPQEI